MTQLCCHFARMAAWLSGPGSSIWHRSTVCWAGRYCSVHGQPHGEILEELDPQFIAASGEILCDVHTGNWKFLTFNFLLMDQLRQWSNPWSKIYLKLSYCVRVAWGKGESFQTVFLEGAPLLEEAKRETFGTLSGIPPPPPPPPETTIWKHPLMPPLSA